jgi:hypothetical protein
MDSSMRKLLLVLLTLTVLWPTGPVWSQDDDLYGEALLPPETLLMLSAPDVPAMLDRLNSSATGQLFTDPKLQPVIRQLMDKVGEFSDAVTERLGVSLKDLAGLPQGEITFAIVEKPARKLNGVLLLDYGDKEEIAGKLFEKMDEALTGNGAEHSTQKIGEMEIEVYKLAGGADNPIKTLAYFADEGYFVLATDVDALKSVLDRWNGDAKRSLANQEVFEYIMEKTNPGDEEAAIKWFINPIGLVQAGISLVQGQNPQAGLVMGMLPILGLDRLKAFGGTMDVGVGEYDSVSRAFVYVEQPPAGVLGLFQFPATDLTPPPWVPADAALYMGLNWDFEEAYLAVESLVDSFQGPGALRKILDNLAADEDGPGIHVKDDVLDNLAGKVLIVTQPPADTEDEDAPPVPPVMVSIAVKDAAAMQKTLDKAAKSDGFPGESRQFEGVTVYDLPAGEQTVTIAVVGEALVVSTDPVAMEKMIRKEAPNPLANSPAYKAFVQHLPMATSLLSFQKSDAQAKSAYELLKNQDNDQLEGIDLSALPDFSDIQKYLKPTISYTIPDENGALFIGFSLKGK